MQIDTRVLLHEDGSATITEKLRFSRRLLDLDNGNAENGSAGISSLLSKEAALERMKHMGEGITLVSHEVDDVASGARESVSIFRISDLNNFQYISPWLAYADYAENNVIKAKLYPLYKSRPSANGHAGEMVVNFTYLKQPKVHVKPEKDQLLPSGPSPSELQIYRDLGPVFRDMLKDFRVRFTFESYAPILRSGLGVRGLRSGTQEIDLINFSDKDLDAYGDAFLDNEEVMLDLVRFDFGSPNVVNNVKDFVHNNTLPIFVPHGSAYMWWTGGWDIPFKPSRALFDKHFTGKKLDYGIWQSTPLEDQEEARFDKIGWKGSK